MTHRRFLVPTAAVLLLGVCLSVAPGDEIGDSLKEAKIKQAAELTQAETVLLKAFDAAIVKAAKDKDADLVQALLDQKTAFQETSTPPESKEVIPPFQAYVAQRKTLAAELYKHYQRAANSYAEKLLAAESKSVNEEAKKFLAVEKLVLEKLGSSAPKVGGTAPARSTAELAQDFIDKRLKEPTARKRRLAFSK